MFHNFRKLCNTSVCYEITTLSNCCFCIFLPKNYKLSKRTILKKDVWDKEKILSPHEGLPVTSPPGRLATSELATKERSRHQRTRHQAKSSRHQPPIKR